MRISDWSSDVCSSDLTRGAIFRPMRQRGEMQSITLWRLKLQLFFSPSQLQLDRLANKLRKLAVSNLRSEEHTSELQSLMRTSYAVFCLKKKRTNTKLPTTTASSHTHMKQLIQT